MGILDTIKKAFNMMPQLAGSVGQLALTVIVLGTVVGVFTYQVVTAGNIDVDATSSALVAEQSANFSSVVNTVWAAVNSVTGFIVLGVIALIAIGLLGRKFLGGGRV